MGLFQKDDFPARPCICPYYVIIIDKNRNLIWGWIRILAMSATIATVVFRMMPCGGINWTYLKKHNAKTFNVYLPRASEGWREVIFSVRLHLWLGVLHPADGEGGGCTPILPNQGVHRSFLMGVPYPSWLGCWYPHLADGCTPSGQQEGTPDLADGVYPPPPSGLLGYPVGTGRGTPPHKDWICLPPSLSGNRAAERVLATRRAVCILRSHRRTLLF